MKFDLWIFRKIIKITPQDVRFLGHNASKSISSAWGSTYSVPPNPYLDQSGIFQLKRTRREGKWRKGRESRRQEGTKKRKGK